MTILKGLKLKSFNKKMLDNYSSNDWIKALLKEKNKSYPKKNGTNNWLIESLAKRAIVDYMYGDLIANFNSKNILDIGGGINMLQKTIASKNQLTVVDLLSHDDKEVAAEYCRNNNINLVCKDWLDYFKNEEKKVDLLIACDLFPNVDQRLKVFLNYAKKISKEVRILLTYYDDRYYHVKRVGADEQMFVMAWSDLEIKNCLLKFIGKTKNIEIHLEKNESLFSNGRYISILNIWF